MSAPYVNVYMDELPAYQLAGWIPTGRASNGMVRLIWAMPGQPRYPGVYCELDWPARGRGMGVSIE